MLLLQVSETIPREMNEPIVDEISYVYVTNTDTNVIMHKSAVSGSLLGVSGVCYIYIWRDVQTVNKQLLEGLNMFH